MFLSPSFSIIHQHQLHFPEFDLHHITVLPWTIYGSPSSTDPWHSSLVSWAFPALYPATCIPLCSSPLPGQAHLPLQFCNSFLQPRSLPLHRLLIATFTSTCWEAHLRCYLFHDVFPLGGDLALLWRTKQCVLTFPRDMYPSYLGSHFGFLHGADCPEFKSVTLDPSFIPSCVRWGWDHQPHWVVLGFKWDNLLKVPGASESSICARSLCIFVPLLNPSYVQLNPQIHDHGDFTDMASYTW